MNTAGDFDTPVWLQERTPTVTHGETTYAWADVGTEPQMWARFTWGRWAEALREGRKVATREAVAALNTRRTDVTTAHRLRLGGTSGSPTGVMEIQAVRRRTLHDGALELLVSDLDT